MSCSVDFGYLFSCGPDYWDYQLLAFLKFGTFLCPTITNHNLARVFPQYVLTYLQEEKGHGSIFAPFPFPPFITREKSDSEKRSVIIDLSFPPDHTVNSGVPKNMYLGTAFELHYPTIDMITQRLCDIGPGAHIYKIDLRRVFRQLPLLPPDAFAWEFS